MLNNWQDVILEDNFDLNFWGSHLRTLIYGYEKLPKILRYEKVSLKRELINRDYEHIWLEIYNLYNGTNSFKKIEIRLSASQIDRYGFNALPKIEIPLVNGEDKPFPSWFEESFDIMGPKLEIRFSVKDRKLDAKAISKLNDVDKSLVLQIIYAFPRLIDALSSDGVKIQGRLWSEWRDLALSVISIFTDLQKIKKNSSSQMKNKSTEIKVISKN